MLKNTIHFFFLTCIETTLLLEKRAIQKLSKLEKFRLNAHLFLCKECSSYNKKSKIIDNILKKTVGSEKEIEKNIIDIQLFKKNLKENLKK